MSSLANFTPLPIGNIEFGWDAVDERLVIIIGCGAAHRTAAGPSASGKSRLLATTHGFVPVPGVPGLEGLSLQVNATLPKARP